MKTGEDFKNSAEENHIEYWPVHNCSMCEYPCAYLFNFAGHEVVYDSGCDCISWGYNRQRRTWDDVAKLYNWNIQNPETMKKYNEFWKFANE